jgi:aspartyl-tRNA synthetase
MLRTHSCGQLNEDFLGLVVKLGGWVHAIRNHGSLVFVDLRDYQGLVQCVVDQEKNPELVVKAASLRCESMVFISGKVTHRSEDTINLNLPSGKVEVVITEIDLDNMAEQLPLQVAAEDQHYPEDLRLKYRYLDLRSRRLHNNIVLRNDVCAFLRREMWQQGFQEFQTPLLTASSPEGARDFLVPSRLYPGKFYALPQAPQLFKQLLMISGFDKYFQIAPCFRDEGLRADRTLEFYQLDVEMSFVEQEDIFKIMETVLTNLYGHFTSRKVSSSPFIRLSYADALMKYGTDKPDLRNPLEIVDMSDIFKDSGFSVFAEAVKTGSVVRAISAKGVCSKSRSFFDGLVDYAVAEGSKGLGYMVFSEEGEAKGPVAKFLDEERVRHIRKRANLAKGDAIFFICNKVAEAAKLAGKIRMKLGQELEMITTDEYKFCWIMDFPLYEIDEETGQLGFCHNPFSMPRGGLDAFNEQNPLDITAYQFDCVCNGYEMCSGAIRNHKPEIMYKAFELIGYTRETVNKNFSGLLNAFRYGAPPHGGCAFGIDRLVMLLLDEVNLREVVAFPFNGKGVDLLMNSPAMITATQLKELHLSIVSDDPQCKI